MKTKWEGWTRWDRCSGMLLSAILIVGAPAYGGIFFSDSTTSSVDPKSLSPSTPLAKRLQDHVAYLASPDLNGREPGTPGNRKAAAYITNEFQHAGLQPLPSLGSYRQEITPELGDNLIGYRPASSTALNEARWILLGAHFDHLGTPYLGADDNASGVAILLETAALLPPLAHHHVLFVGFNTEEPPYIRTPLMGSQFFVDHLPPEVGDPGRIQTAIIMDLMGGAHWKPLEHVVFAIGAEKSPGLYRRVKEAGSSRAPDSPSLEVVPLGLHLLEEVPVVGPRAFSDYDAFCKATVPFVFLSAGRTPRYHEPTDLPDTLHYDRMAATVHWLETLIERIEQDASPYAYEPDRVVLSEEIASLRPLVSRAAERETRIPGSSFLSLWRLQQDARWLETVDPSSASEEIRRRLERISIRMQCLLVDYVGCFLI